MSSGARQRRQKRRHSLSHDQLLQALRDLPREACRRPDKTRYKSLNHAEIAADKQWWSDRRILTPYRCSNHFHLTSHPHGKVTAA